MKIKHLLFAFALLVPASALADDQKGTSPATGDTSKTGSTNKTTDKTAATKLAEADIQIVAHLHAVNVMEIDMGKLAQKAGTQAVKRYGEMMVKDHGSADKELTAMAKKKGVAKIPGAKHDTEAQKIEHKQMLDAMAGLKKLKGADFDREYVRLMIDSHQKELTLSDPLISQATDADLKAMLESRKTTLQRHADAARELEKGNAQASGDKSGTGGAGTSKDTGGAQGPGKTVR